MKIDMFYKSKIALLLTVTMILIIPFSFSVSAAESQSTFGELDNGFSWSYNPNEKILTINSKVISGENNGIMPDFQENNRPWEAYKNVITTISFNNVKTIGKNAFNGFTALKFLGLPVSVDKIEDSAFANCTNLQTVSFHATIVEENAFSNCTSLYLVKVGDFLDLVKQNAFLNCKDLKIVEVSKFKVYNTLLVNVESTGNTTFLSSMYLAKSEVKVSSLQIGTELKRNFENSGQVYEVFNIRVIGGIDSLGYDAVGIEVYLIDNGKIKGPYSHTISTVCNSVLAMTEDGLVEITASQLSATYLAPLVIQNVPNLPEGVTLLMRLYTLSEGNYQYSASNKISFNFEGIK